MSRGSISPLLTRVRSALHAWFDTQARQERESEGPDRVEWLRILPLIALHLGCLAVLVVGTTPVAVAVALYLIRMFAITAFYHRYFSHRTFRMSRRAQFVAAVLGSSAVQRGPLWWAAHHRHHHRHSDEEEDVHSPVQHGFWWSHLLWLTSRDNFATRMERVPDLARFPELRWLDRYDTAVPAALGALLLVLGEFLAVVAPGLGTSGAQLFVWGFVVSSVVLLHGTCTINSLAHRIGRRRWETPDDSRNSWILALITLGEGWHNNHHRFPGATRQGLRWWEFDPTYYVLCLLGWLGIVRDLRPPPDQAYSADPMIGATKADTGAAA